MQTPPAPTAQGSFAKTPFAHLLVYALERRLSGTFELLRDGASVATLLVTGGAPAKLRTTDGVHYLGDVLLDLGIIDQAALAASLERLQESPRLQGQLLCEAGALDEARLEAGVRAQLERKLEHLFTLPPETEFAFYEGVDALARYGGAPTPIDPLPALWRGIRQRPSWEHVEATLRRLGTSAVRLSAAAQPDRFQFAPAEAAAIDLMRKREVRVADLESAQTVSRSVAQLLAYCLVITRQLDIVEVREAPKPAASPPAAAATSLSMPQTGQAFARVQLQARSVQRQPLVVEEVSVPSGSDARMASPIPKTGALPEEAHLASGALDMPAPPDVGDLDIGAMISTTIRSSMPPPPAADDSAAPLVVPPGSAIAPPPLEPSGAEPAPGPTPAPRELSREQNALKQKIVERADGITAQNYFQMLGVPKDATAEAVRTAFIALAKVWHPDRLPAALSDVKDSCSKVFAHLTEAHATLTDAKRRQEYMTLLKEGGATPEEQAKVQAVVEAATTFQKAEFHMKRNDTAQAYELATRAHQLDPEEVDYVALMTWIEAQRPECLAKEKTLEKIAVLEGCLRKSVNCERAHFYRGMLYKRIDESTKAYRDFRRAAELNPRNLDAAREVRLHKMRGGTSVAPPPTGGHRPSNRPPQPEKLSGLFGKLFKK